VTQNTIYLLCAGGLILGLIAVVIDRLNFPQRRFVARGVRISPGDGATRDRTGAHIIDLIESGDPAFGDPALGKTAFGDTEVSE
jgi:hypothetical protein